MNFERTTGVGSFLKLKSPSKPPTKDDFSNIRTLKKGFCLFGNSTKAFNCVNSYHKIVLSDEKPGILDIFSLNEGFNNGSLLFSSRSKKWLILGSSLGLVYVYKIIKKKEGIRSEIPSSKHFPHKSISSIQSFEGWDEKKRDNKRISLRFSINKRENIDKQVEGGHLLLEEKVKSYYPVKRVFLKGNTNDKIAFFDHKDIDWDNKDSPILTNRSLYKRNKGDLADNRDNLRKVPCNLVNTNTQSKILIEYMFLLKGHTQKITSLRFYEVMFMLFSADAGGIVCLWDLDKGNLLIKVFSYHFLDLEVYKAICFEKAEDYINIRASNRKETFNKLLCRREGIVDLSVCEENGDFCFVSSSYASVYTVNGVLVSIIHKKKEKVTKFTCCLISQVNDYIIKANNF